MNRKVLINISTIFAIFLCMLLLLGLIWNFTPHVFKTPLEKLLSTPSQKVEITDIYWEKDELNLTKIRVINNDQKDIFSSESIILTTSLKDVLTSMSFSANVRFVNSMLYDKKLTLSFFLRQSLHTGTIENVKLSFGDNNFKANLRYKFKGGKIQYLKSNGEIGYISSEFLKEVGKVFTGVSFFGFIDKYIAQGDISGNWMVDLDRSFFKKKKFSKDNVSGEFELKKVKVRYLSDFPIVDIAEAKAKMEGLSLDFDILEGNSSKLNLISAKVGVNFQEDDKNNAVIHTKCIGPASELASFIPPKALQDLKDADIDFTKLKGVVDSVVHIVIPLDDKPIEYNVTANIKNAELDIFNKKAEVSNGNLVGSFDGKKIKIDGHCKVNNFNSSISYLMNLDDTSDYDHELNLLIKFESRKIDSKELKVHSGATPLKVVYRKKGNNVYIDSSSDLSDISFSVDKINLHKKAGKVAELHISNSYNKTNLYEIKLVGDDELAIEAYLTINGGNYLLDIDKVKYNDTEFSGDIELLDDRTIAKIRGRSINLARIPIFDLFSSDSSDSSGPKTLDVEINFDKIVMHNDIILDKVNIDIECDKVRCYRGKIKAGVGTKEIIGVLVNKPGIDKWKIISTNAGATLNALGLYEDLLAGDLNLVINKYLGRPGYIDGEFTLEKFVSADLPFLTKLVTITSFPGLISAITDNDNVPFRKMKGKISYEDDIFKVTDCQADGPYFDFTTELKVNTNKRNIIMKGVVSPSFFGISETIRAIPLIGRLMSYKNQSVVGAPYVFEFKY